QIHCIDNAINERELRNGIAQYWDAKYIQAFSKLKMNLAQHIENLEEHRWITSRKFYKKNYDFAIISENANPPYKISYRKLVEINGEPESTISCGDKQVLIYGQAKLRVRRIVNPGDSYQWKACKLPTIIGSHTIDCQSEKTDLAQAGYLTFGPYETLPSGEYFFEIEYMSSKNISDTAGVWDIVIALPTQAKIVAKGDLPGTDNKINKISGLFTLEQKHDMDRVEIRTFAYKDGVMRVDYLKIKRLE
ncbi:MAG: hypothetical protein KDI50_11945, partial [Candidatus Competibacteraceae bacterium]|nr:hypothetical protein [Candidatus Competibacteraceae bacterium]